MKTLPKIICISTRPGEIKLADLVLTGSWCLTAHTTIFQLYLGSQLYWWSKSEYPGKTTNVASHWQTSLRILILPTIPNIQWYLCTNCLYIRTQYWLIRVWTVFLITTYIIVHYYYWSASQCTYMHLLISDFYQKIWALVWLI